MIQGGFLVVDKPPGITSHDVVGTIRAVTGIKKVGHTGTLDPFATGVLPLAIGRSTRLIQFLDERTKTYEATVQLGASTDTGDPTGDVVASAPVPTLDAAHVQEVLRAFEGDRMQRPPAYSAVKVNGKRLYKYAREGQAVQAEPRPIHIVQMVLDGISGDSVEFSVTCSRGTYVRVLAEEIAKALGTEGHLSALRRSRSGPFELAQALSFPELSKLVADRDDWQPVLRPPRGVERVPWAPRDEVWQHLQSRLQAPASKLEHLPVLQLTGLQREGLQRRGTTPPHPPGVSVGELFVARSGDELVAVLRREEHRTKIARMFALE